MKTTLQAILAWLPTLFIGPLTPAREFILFRLTALAFWAFSPLDDETDAALEEMRAGLKTKREDLAASVAANQP